MQEAFRVAFFEGGDDVFARYQKGLGSASDAFGEGLNDEAQRETYRVHSLYADEDAL